MREFSDWRVDCRSPGGRLSWHFKIMHLQWLYLLCGGISWTLAQAGSSLLLLNTGTSGGGGGGGWVTSCSFRARGQRPWGHCWSGLVWLRPCMPVLTCQLTKFNLMSASTEAWATSPLCFCFFSSKLSDGVKFTEKIPNRWNPPELLWTILHSHYIKTHCFTI